jgi:hypothetical protein
MELENFLFKDNDIEYYEISNEQTKHLRNGSISIIKVFPNKMELKISQQNISTTTYIYDFNKKNLLANSHKASKIDIELFLEKLNLILNGIPNKKSSLFKISK